MNEDIKKEIREIIHTYCGGNYENRRMATELILQKCQEKQLTLTDVSQLRELLIAFDAMREFDIKHDDIEESVDYFLKHKESYLQWLTELCKISINGIETINIKIMDKCKWNFKVLNHYVRLTVENRFIILGYRGENWKELVNINFTLCQQNEVYVLMIANGQ